MKYAIGLDCGIASIGYAVMQLDENDEPCRIIRLGSRVFNKAENPKDGASLALPRREARGLRRRIRRHQHRLERIRNLLVSSGVLSQEQLDGLFCGKLSDIYMLRAKALDEPLSAEEFARVLIHLAQRRGFRSNRKTDAQDKEAGKLLSAVADNRVIMETGGYRTVGEMLYKDSKFSEYKRNKGENYANTVSRDMIAEEISAVFAAQRKFSPTLATEELERSYTDIALSQRPFDLGPGAGPANSPSPYAGDQIAKMIGQCTLLPEEKRAAKASYSFQLFTLWQNINNIRIAVPGGQARGLTDDERARIFELCHKKKEVKYSSLRKELSLDEGEFFASLSYGSKEPAEVEKAAFSYLKPFHQIKSALDKIKKDYIYTLSDEQLDDIGYIFTVNKTDDAIISALKARNFDETVIDALLSCGSFSKFGHISVKACRMLIPYLETGLTYDKACEAAGLDFKAHSGNIKEKYLSASSDYLSDITNPVVRRAVSQTVKVINAIIREEGCSPTYLNIELARELSKTYSERKAAEKSMQENAAVNARAVERLQKEFGIHNPTGMDIVKFKLWQEQDGICPYSQKPILLNKLFEPGYVDVDHIIPYSICFDDSYSNKVLVFSRENRQKGNKIPMQYLSGTARDNFEIWVTNNIRNSNKRKKLLKTELKAEDTEGFKKRNLNDTKYLSRVLYNFINDTLLFADFESGRKKHVRAVNGKVTSYMRKRWGIAKIRADGDLHHAVDAAVIACVTESMIKKVSTYSNYREIYYTGDGDTSVAVDFYGTVIDEFPQPYPYFRKELDARTCDDAQRAVKDCRFPHYSVGDEENVKSCFVSRMPSHKVTGAAHLDTIRSGREPGFTVSKVPLSRLKLGKDGEIENYYNPKSDTLLYNALKARLAAFGGSGEKAFPPDEPFYKPTASGEPGPLVKKVKIIEKSSLNVPVRSGNGVAANGDMVRIDIFKPENDGYYFIPVYVSDTVKPELPNKACVAYKNYTDWKEMKDSDFLFSVYPNDLLRVRAKKDIKFTVSNKDSTLPREILHNDVFVYYVSAGISTASLTVITHDNSYKVNSLGLKTLLSVEKYTVDPLGNYSKVGRETRQKFR